MAKKKDLRAKARKPSKRDNPQPITSQALTDPSLEKFGKRIRELRTSHSLSQAEFARRCYVDQAALCRIESGHANPTLKTLEAIASGLNIPIEHLFNDKLEIAISTASLINQLSLLIAVQREALSHAEKLIDRLNKQNLPPKEDPEPEGPYRMMTL